MNHRRNGHNRRHEEAHRKELQTVELPDTNYHGALLTTSVVIRANLGNAGKELEIKEGYCKFEITK